MIAERSTTIIQMRTTAGMPRTPAVVSTFCSHDYDLGVVIDGDRSVAVRIDIDGVLAEVVPRVAAIALDLDLRTLTGRGANLHLDALGFAIALA